MPESNDETSERLRIQIIDDNGAGEIFYTVWPGLDPGEDGKYSKTIDIVDVDDLNDNQEAIFPLLMALDKQLSDCELTDIISAVASAVWERAKIEFKGE